MKAELPTNNYRILPNQLYKTPKWSTFKVFFFRLVIWCCCFLNLKKLNWPFCSRRKALSTLRIFFLSTMKIYFTVEGKYSLYHFDTSRILRSVFSAMLKVYIENNRWFQLVFQVDWLLKCYNYVGISYFEFY